MSEGPASPVLDEEPAERTPPSEELSAASSVTDGLVQEAGSPSRDAQVRRISYFMLFRLGILTLFTAFAAFTGFLHPEHSDGRSIQDLYEWITWITLGLGYAITLGFAWWLRRAPRLDRLVSGQLIVDVALAAVLVQVTGGLDSGFVFLYLVAILGAAVMGNRTQTWAATGACALIYLTMSLLQVFDVAQPIAASQSATALSRGEIYVALGRNVAAIGAVGALSVYLNTQLSRSVRQVDSLRALNENIVRSLSSGLITVDADGVVLFANPMAVELLVSGSELAGRVCEDIMPGVAAHLNDSGGVRNRFELELRRGDGKTLRLGLNCSPLLDKDARFLGHVIHFQDVTELRELELKVRRNERLAAIGGLAASVAHEVRNPLAAISGCAELLEPARAQSEDARLLDVIKRETQRLSTTVNDLLIFARPQRPRRMPTDLLNLVSVQIDAFRVSVADQDLRVILRDPEPVAITADPDLLTQVLWNLMRNAAEAIEDAGIEDGSIEVQVRGDEAWAEITIQDNGPGIPADRVNRVFEPYFSTKSKGSGFGLAVVHRIVGDHNGELDVESSPEGSCFRIRLPVHGPEESSPTSPLEGAPDGLASPD